MPGIAELAADGPVGGTSTVTRRPKNADVTLTPEAVAAPWRGGRQAAP